MRAVGIQCQDALWDYPRCGEFLRRLCGSERNRTTKTIEADIPDRLYELATEFAARNGVSLEKVLTMALSQALAAWTEQGDVARRAARGDRERFLAALAMAPDVEPAAEDR